MSVVDDSFRAAPAVRESREVRIEHVRRSEQLLDLAVSLVAERGWVTSADLSAIAARLVDALDGNRS